MPDADMVHLLARVEADPCTEPLHVSTGYGGAGSAEVKPWWLFWPGTDHFPRPLVSDGNNAGLPSSQALLTPAVNPKGLGERKERSTPACRQDKASGHGCQAADT